jgi:hypothetical protein
VNVCVWSTAAAHCRPAPTGLRSCLVWSHCSDLALERPASRSSVEKRLARSLCRSLIRVELVDRFRVVVFPVVTGATGQDRIYDGYPDIRLDLVESRTFDGGLQLLEYVPTVLDGPPGATAATS